MQSCKGRMADGCNCVCSQPPISSFISCGTCGSTQHHACMQKATSMPYYECPQCQLKRSNPFLEVLQFCLFPHVIDSNPIILRSIPYLKDQLVLIRCLKLTAEGYCTAWPEQTTIIVNDMVAFQGSNKTEIQDISGILKRLKAPVKIQLNAERAGEYVWSIAVCRKRTREQVEPFLCINNETIARSLDLLFDSGKKSEALVKILPTKSHFIPHSVRGYLCTHYTCFDLEDWLQVRVAQKTAGWKCPICQKSCLEFRFDAVQYRLQTQFAYAIEVDLRVGLDPVQVDIREKDPVPGKKAKVEDGVSFRFEDFLSGSAEVETDLNYKRQLKALQGMWEGEMKAEMEEARGVHCYHPSIPPSLEDFPFTISHIRTYIDLDSA